MNGMQIVNAKYHMGKADTVTSVKAIIDGQELFVPLDPANRHYAAILKAVEEGTLVIQEATA